MDAIAKEYQHDHTFGLDAKQKSEQRTLLVVYLTLITMVVELTAGFISGSMALLADGWHMSTHAAALSISVFAYSFARKHAQNPTFTFGTGKVNALGGFASAISLAIVSLLMAVESIDRLISPVEVEFKMAIMVAVIGLVVNVASAFLLAQSGEEGGHHSHHHNHHHHKAEESLDGGHQDHNLKAAYMHVIADALTSVTAIVALICGYYWGWVWMDPAMGIVGSVVIAVWAAGLLKQTSHSLLDAEDTTRIQKALTERIKKQGVTGISDLHVWRVGPSSWACIIALVSNTQLSPEQIRASLQGLPGLDHVTVEINHIS
ncbi:MAG: CDF family Co(II)/Ni(II) efflux transporter DmeF [Magnetococcales bacterium]|nr:CDF family Co(II)/Ni(II) efflux transporter DmeF [Magnetococcales bacterium]